MSKIHKTAIVDRDAELDSDVEIGAYSVIDAGVRIGKGTKVASHVVIEGRTSLGPGNEIFQFATVGSKPQDLKFKGEPSQLVIGANNVIREYVSLNPGTEGGGMVTRIGDHNLLMMHCHIAHDCLLGSHNVIANGATLGGHVIVQDYVIVTLKATGLAPAAASILPLLGPDTANVTAMNGIPWWYFHKHGGPHDGKRPPKPDARLRELAGLIRDASHVVVLTGAGIGLGLLVSAWMMQFVRSLLYEVEATDPASLAAVALLLGAIAALAAWRPTHRAMRADPLALLRDG